jgi:cytochrome c oxidase subunit 4
MEKDKEHVHIVPYRSHGIILIILLCLTALTITITMVHLSTFTVTVAMIIASTKGFLVMNYFMHLKYEKQIFKVVGFGVVILFGLLVLLTFFDYWFR